MGSDGHKNNFFKSSKLGYTIFEIKGGDAEKKICSKLGSFQYFIILKLINKKILFWKVKGVHCSMPATVKLIFLF